MAECRATVNKHRVITGWQALAFDFMHCPIQYREKYIDIIATDAHFQFLQGSRAVLRHMHSFDKKAHTRCMSNLDADERC